MAVEIEDVRTFWDNHPCGANLSREKDRRNYFHEIEQKRYSSEWHIPIIARFHDFRGKDVLEIGCGIGTDGLQFARNGARYTGVDLTPTAVKYAKEQFKLFGISGRFEVVDAENLPFPDESFDHVYSYGVIHHSPNTEAIVKEMHRVLRPGGTLCVMVYNKSSINYYIEIMLLRKLFRFLLYPSFMPRLISKITGIEEWKLQGHRELMLKKGRMSKQKWITINTDGPYCPLSKVYSREDVLQLFREFEDVRTEVWYFNRSHWPFTGKLLPESVSRWLGMNWGWHRIVYGRKGI